MCRAAEEMKEKLKIRWQIIHLSSSPSNLRRLRRLPSGMQRGGGGERSQNKENATHFRIGFESLAIDVVNFV